MLLYGRGVPLCGGTPHCGASRKGASRSPLSIRRDLARAELAKETGLRAGWLQHLGYLDGDHGTSTQRFHVSLATELQRGAASPEPTEQGMGHDWILRKQFRRMVESGAITDASTLAAYALLLMKESSNT